jgi:hypothetical protein
MTASTPTGIDLGALDARIARALAALRLARVASARRGSPEYREAEARAETELNALLEYRHTVVHRPAGPWS